MAKIVKDNFLVQVERLEGEIVCSAHYSVMSEGVEQKRGMKIELTPAQETSIENFVMNVVLPEVKDHEEAQ
tara:strand:+ start:10 stop:222 length:213 start_codon:yes stop_codon:yes gene_type:complete